MNAVPAILFAIVGLAFAASAGAQDGPIRILVGFPPGGESDLVARLVADRMRLSLSGRPSSSRTNRARAACWRQRH
jgi:tripartite-type tricarboxylate transporter receptor subunit TctC